MGQWNLKTLQKWCFNLYRICFLDRPYLRRHTYNIFPHHTHLSLLLPYPNGIDNMLGLHQCCLLAFLLACWQTTLYSQHGHLASPHRCQKMHHKIPLQGLHWEVHHKVRFLVHLFLRLHKSNIILMSDCSVMVAVLFQMILKAGLRLSDSIHRIAILIIGSRFE